MNEVIEKEVGDAIESDETPKAKKRGRKKGAEKPNIEESLATQSAALRRLVANSGMTVIQIGEKIGTHKQNLHIWMSGRAVIPEPAVQKLAEVFGVHPAEIRYDIPAFSKEDLKETAIMLEEHLKSIGKELDPVSKAKAIVYLYGRKTKIRREMFKEFADVEFETNVKDYIESLQ